MRRYRLFTKPAAVKDVLNDDRDLGTSDLWQEKAEELQKRRWRRVRNQSRFFKRERTPRVRVAWDS